MSPLQRFGRSASILVLTLLTLAVPFASSQAKKPEPIYDPSTHRSNIAARPHIQAQSRTSSSDNSSCTLITFEGLGDLAAIPDIQGVQLPDWLSIIEEAAGGVGNFADEPSPVTIAFWLYGNPTSQTINIPNGASSISLYYATAYPITLTGYDSNGNVIVTASGAANYPGSGLYDVWSPLGITAPSGSTIASMVVSGYANYTGIDNLNVCQSATIASVEMTQAIQQYQTLSDLKSSLSSNGEPPVPVISGKPMALRVYLNPVEDVTNVTIALSGVATGSQSLALQPGCTPPMQRARTNGCSSIDFYFTPPSGSWTATLDVLDPTGTTVEEENLPVTSRDTDSLLLRGVSVCDAKDANGAWLCASASDLLTKLGLITKIAPTSSVTADITSSVVRNDIATTTTSCDPQATTPDDCWWPNTVSQVESLYGVLDYVGDFLADRRSTYFGMVRPAPAAPAADPLGGTGGIANGIPSHAAIGRTSALRFASNTETNFEVVAHETGHTLGLKHTNTAVAGNGSAYPAPAPPGCYFIAQDPSTDWPFPNNQIQSTTQLEVGYDVANHATVDPANDFEVMSYCSPRWISPQRYKTMIATLGGGSVSSPSSRKAAQPSQTSAASPQAFWKVSGVINSTGVVFGPLFEISTVADTSAGSGDYSLVVKNAAGAALFTRAFTPTAPATESTKKNINGLPGFTQMVPVQADATVIVLLSPQNTELGRITLGGVAPKIAVVSPAGGTTQTGTDTVSWTVSGASSFTTLVWYSADGGATWSQLGTVVSQTSLPVDFDTLPGSSKALIKIFVSDGVNTATATSEAFNVLKKKPSAINIDTPTPNFAQPASAPVYLTGSAYDVDDGALTGSALQWSSNIQGILGSGSPLTATLKPGKHTITLAAIDSDGNEISATTNVLIAGAPPVVTLTATPLNTVPTTCEYATLAATPGAQGAPLSSAQYSVDGGATYTTVPLASLPYGFVVPGSGFLHLILRAYDTSGQSNATDLSFLTQGACTLATQTITFPVIPSQTYGVAPIALKATASSGLPVSFAVSGPATLSGSTLTITGAGQVTVTASQAGNQTYAPANLVSQTFAVGPATLTATAKSFSRPAGQPNPTLTYSIAGFVDGDTQSVVSGSATLATTATTSSAPGEYPITFASEALTAANYTFHYVPGTLTVTSSAGPQIKSLNWTYGAPYSVVILNGLNFGATQGSSTVTFNGIPTPHYYWANTQVYVTVPPQATTGNLIITVNGVASNPVLFTVLPMPVVTGISPTSGPNGTVVTISGKNLLDYENHGTVTFNGKELALISQSSTAIEVAVPSGAITGKFHVLVNDTGINTPTFTVPGNSASFTGAATSTTPPSNFRE